MNIKSSEMEQMLCYFGSLFFLMLITGVFRGTWFTLTRSISSFSSGEFAHIGKVIISNVAFPMRIILPTGIVLIMLTLWFSRKDNPLSLVIGIASLFLVIVVLLLTVIVLVPIDNNIRKWSGESIPEEWEQIRKKWAAFHAIRTFASLTSFALYTLFLLLTFNTN